MTQTWIPPRGIERASPIPFYYQLQEILKQEIEDGRWVPGELMPSEEELGRALGVSRPVIRKALEILQGDGQIIRLRGKGSMVAQPKFPYEALVAAGTWASGVSSTPYVQRVVARQRTPAVGHVARVLGIGPGVDVFELSVTHAIGGMPASLTTLFLCVDAMAQLPLGQLPEIEHGAADLITQLSAKYGLEVAESEMIIEATSTNAFEADLLGIEKGAPVFLLSSLEMGAKKRPVGFSRTIARSDHFRFSAIIRRTDGGVAPQFLSERRDSSSDWQSSRMTAPTGR